MRAEAYIADNQKEKAIADLKKTKQICQSKNDKVGEVVADVQLERLTPADAKIIWRKDVMALVSGKERKAPTNLFWWTSTLIGVAGEK